MALSLFETVERPPCTRANTEIVKPGATIPGLAKDGPSIQEEQGPLHVRSEHNGAENLTDLEVVWVHHGV